MTETETLAAARAFVRSWNILLKQAALYGLGHSRSAAQLEATWKELRHALAGNAKLGLAANGDKLLLGAAPLGTGTAERSLAAFLSAAGIARLDFHPAVTAEEFSALVQAFCAAKPADVVANLKPELGKSLRNIRVLEFRVVETEASEMSAAGQGDVAGSAHNPHVGAEFNLDILQADPRRLLEFLTHPASGESPGSDSQSASSAGVLQEHDVLGVIRWLTRFAGPQTPESADAAPSEAPSDLQRAVQKVLPAKPGRELHGAALLRLAEQVALRAVAEKYERGEFDVVAVQLMLERMNRELDVLRKVLRAREEQMGRAGLAIENNAEVLDRQFWEGIADQHKRKVLLSPDAWVIPSYNVRSFVEPLLAGAERNVGIAMLRHYCRFLDSADPQACRKTAAGIGKLADLYAAVECLGDAVERAGERFSREPAGDLAQLLKDSFILLGREAIRCADYPALEEWLHALDVIESRQPGRAQGVRSQVTLTERVRDMVEAAIRQAEPPKALLEVLKRVPEPAARHLAAEFQRCSRREECGRVAHVLHLTGPESMEHLREMLRRGSESDAVASAGLLAILDPDFLLKQLATRLEKMSRLHQDAAVRLIAAAGTAERGRLLLEILHCLDPMVMPVAVDEIGIAGNVPPSKLIDLAQGLGFARQLPFLQVKAIEALGRLREKSAVPLLSRMLTARTLLSWEYPREIRVVAAQALQRVEPAGSRSLVSSSGLDARELSVGPLVAPAEGWVRQRKYPRVRPDAALVGSLLGAGGPANLQVEAISLGGGMATTVRDAQEGADAALDLYIGLRKLPTHVIIRQTRPHQVSFEFVDIKLEDRSRLRAFVTSRIPARTVC